MGTLGFEDSDVKRLLLLNRVFVVWKDQTDRPERHTKKTYRFPRHHRNLELLLRHRFRDQLGHCGHNKRKEKIIIFNGGEVRVMGTRSGFATAGAFAFAFSATPTSVWIVNTFESAFAFALRSSLVLPENVG